MLGLRRREWSAPGPPALRFQSRHLDRVLTLGERRRILALLLRRGNILRPVRGTAPGHHVPQPFSAIPTVGSCAVSTM